MITIKFYDAAFTAEIQALSARLQRPVGLARVLGREAVNVLKTHFREKQRREPNKLGGKRQNFWRAVASSVNSPTISGDGRVITVAITDPRFAQKIYGGTIRAKRANALTIPVDKRAYGRTAETLEHELGIKLFLVPRDFGSGLLAAVLKGSKRGDRITVFYVLRKSVNQQADPTALPTKDALLAALLIRARAHVARITAQPGGAA